MKLKHLLIPFIAFASGFAAEAVPVKVTMNTVSTTMSLAPKDGGEAVDVGEPTARVYTFDAPAGDYVLTAYASNGTTVNGTIELTVPDATTELEYTILTNTAYVSNKNEDGSTWSVANGDYTLDVTVNTREGERQTITVGESTTAGRNTFLAFNGNSYNVAFIPSEAHQAEGYTTLYKAGTLTFNVNVYGAIPKAADYTITLPSDAELMLGIKFTHFTNFEKVEPKATEVSGDTKTVTYRLADNQQYNYRTWKKDGLTQAGYFTMSIDPAKCPVVAFTEADYKAFNPHQVNHDPQSNKGYETGDIFLNINAQGHLKMNTGETFLAHAMRTWQLTDNSTNNYFMEPDFHYTVVGLDGKPSTGVIEIENANTTTSPWSQIKAVGTGTAIVLVTYDAIGVNYFSGVNKTEYLGGEHWGAIWPENTGVFVVTVGENASGIKPNMLINDEYNKETLKLAGNNVDAEHDVFYYLDTEEGATYTFSPEGVADITIAYPTIGEQTVTYSGFGSEGVTKNEDGSFTLLLKHGRQIIKMTDAAGKSVYQVIKARECHREITNVTREGSNIFQPGDKIKIQYSGLYHPANKLAGIYNMSAYVTYNGIPNGSSLILGSGQYTFGSAASAQAVSIDIPADYDVNAAPEIVMDNGVIQVNGYGDPIGAHRNINPTAGRSPNFTAIAHKTYFGAIPDVKIPLSAVNTFIIRLVPNVADADIKVMFNGNELTPDENGDYSGTYGTYNIDALKDGYCYYHKAFTIGDDAAGAQTFNIEMAELGNAWDGKTLTEPAIEEDVYLISNGSELAWLSNYVNEGNATANARLTQDVNLGGFPWTPIGNSLTKTFSGNFDGQGYEVNELYINEPTITYQALFGHLKSGSIANLTVSGAVNAKQYVGGVVANIQADGTVDRCVNLADITGTATYVGGVAGNANNATAKITNSYNAGHITGTTNCGGVAGYSNAATVIENVFNIGEISATTAGACVGGTNAKTNVKNAFATKEYGVTTGQTKVTDEQMRSGEVAYLLGEAFGQIIGVDPHPVIGGMKVLYDEDSKTYYNVSYPVTVKMNNDSPTMTLTLKGTDTPFPVGEPENKVYTFKAPAGEYVLTAYATDGETVNGTIAITIAEQEEEQDFTIVTHTAWVTNEHEDGSYWTIEDGDYTFEFTVFSREGVVQDITLGKSIIEARYTFPAISGQTYNCKFIPSEEHQKETYTTLYKNATFTYNNVITGEIPKCKDYVINVPEGAGLFIGIKEAHFTDFTPVEPKSVETNATGKTYTYTLSDDQVYNYRAWKEGGITQAGYFTMSIDDEKRPTLNFTTEDFASYNPKQINHDVKSNLGYETGDLLLNVNEQGLVTLAVGDTFLAHAMRSWELTDSEVANYFFEPDFHYTVLGLDGKPSAGVIEISSNETNPSAWAEIKAVGQGTAIVLVTYDAIKLNTYKEAEDKGFLGGEFWGAIWPENTGAFVVTVGETESAVKPNMIINEKVNEGRPKNAGKYVDAELDVLYYLDSEDGATYTFTPEGTENVTIAYPTIGEQTVTYSGFGSEGVTKNEDGSYTLLLKEGRQIVKLTDAAGNSTYQVMRARPCTREIINLTREGSTIYQPGDQIKIQYKGLFHPANKMAGIYNMSANALYHELPEDIELTSGQSQYKVGSTPAAQAVTIEIPADFDVEANPQVILTGGVIQAGGFGDPFGNHRNTDPKTGRQPNFTAVGQVANFGYLPDVNLTLTAVRKFNIILDCNVEDAEITVTTDGEQLTPDSEGIYKGTIGYYRVDAGKEGYRCYHNVFQIAEDAEGDQTFKVVMVKDENIWDGKTMSEPESIEGVYQLSTGAELAWFANHVNVNEEGDDQDAVMTADIDLGDYDWTPIGDDERYCGKFDGQGFAVKGLYIYTPKKSDRGLFGTITGATVTNLTVYGNVTGRYRSAGVIGFALSKSVVDRCANYADVTGLDENAGGVVGKLFMGTVTNCYNVGDIYGYKNSAGVVGFDQFTGTIENVFNIGKISGEKSGACVSGTSTANWSNFYALEEYEFPTSLTVVTEEQMHSGEVAYKLGDAFGQEIGVDQHPVIGGKKVLYDAATDTYYNEKEPSSGVEDISIDGDEDLIYYNLEGVASDRPFKGFNIIVNKANGTSKKVYIK
ncbi:MAG: hypothetical protein K2J12_03155 [Muribaculaceae bacterium]|nr:hypothetical protein [Muribaculaceae bacterium]